MEPNAALGLTSAEVAAALASSGPNTTTRKPQKPWWRLLLSQFTNPIVLILIGATIVSMLAGDVIDGLIILGIVIPSGLLGFWQEHRAGQTMQSLLKQIQINVEVIRDGVELAVPIEQIVRGDLVVLRAGDVIPADLRILEAKQLLVDQAALTGESFPVEKTTDPGSMELFFGSHVVSGWAKAVVTSTGQDTKYGELVTQLESRDPETGFERGTKAFGRMLLWSMLVLVSFLLVTNLLLHRSILESLLFSLALAVGITPQLLPVIVSVSLAAGARKMANQRVLVKRLDAIEDFGSINVLCTDKTGTLTHGVVSLDAALTPDGKASDRVMELALMNASLQTGFRNPLDEAIIQSASGKVPTAILLSELAYDFERRRLSVLVQEESNSNGDGKVNGASTGLLVTKGAFSSVYPLCEANPQAQELYESLSAAGNRVIALATKELSRAPIDGKIALTVADESNLELVGLLAFLDPPKGDAGDAVAQLTSLGIDLYLITGDNPLAAKQIASQVGMKSDLVVTGTEFAAFDAEQRAFALKNSRVFAEFDPLQKQAVIQGLKDSGNTVGYFGDGINDSAALKIADVGISVDTAVDVAKSAAAIVLLDKSLHVVADGVRLGRRTFVNTMKYVRVAVSAAFGNVFSMAIADVFLPFLPMLPAQILLLNFLTDFPAITISSDNADSEDVAKPRGWRIAEIRRFMIVFGLLSSVFDICSFLLMTLVFKASPEVFRSGWFIESSLTELAVMLTLRTSRRFWKSTPSMALWLSSAVIAVVIIAIPYTPIGSLLQLVPVPVDLLAGLALLTGLYVVLNEAVKKRFFQRDTALRN